MLTATVTGTGAAGSVEFFDGTTSLGKADVSGGTASLTTTALPVGSDSLTATFTPMDATAFTSSTSPPITVTITGNTPPPNGGSETINVDVPQATEGTLTLTVSPTPVQMSAPTNDGTVLDSTGSLSAVTVTDGRTISKPGWNVSGQVSDFHSGSNTIDGNELGWTPKITTPNSANDVTAGPSVTAGANPGLKQGSGLASAAAGKGVGQTTLGGDLDLHIPVDTPAGTYSATLTITAI
jgi:hypothetical protein